MVYLDASLVVALLTPESHSERASSWFECQATGALFVSGWVGTEISSALSIKLRTGAITLDRRAAALSAWRVMLDSSLLTLAVVEEHFDRAARIADRVNLGIRAGGALHLAIVRDSGHSLATLDATMADAAQQLGIPVESI